MSVIDSSQLLAAGDDGYQISRSVRLRSSASAYLDRTFTTPTSRRIFTLSAWTKRGALGATAAILGNAGTREVIGFFGNTSGNGDSLHFRDTTNGAYEVTTTAVFRDPSAWYHVLVAFDTTQATASNRVRMYVNGVQQTSFAVATYPSQNTDLNLNSAVVHAIGRRGDAAAYNFDGYLADVNFIDGQALTPSSFGETDGATGMWKPKRYTGTYGTNGFYLNFSDNSAATAAAIGADKSGNGNNWTPNNISVTAGATYDSMIDVPTLYADGGNGRGNYPVLNPLFNTSQGIGTLSNGNLNFSCPNDVQIPATMSVQSGKWYCEFVMTTIGSGTLVGIQQVNTLTSAIAQSQPNSILYHQNGQKLISGTGSSYGATYTSNDVIGVALDMDGGTVTFYKNNVSQGSINLSLASITDAYFRVNSGGVSTCVGFANFGQRPFTYTPPTGFKALNTQNLPDPTIKKGNAWFDATTYTGNGTSQSVVNSGGFQPDFVWTKTRNAASSHRLTDAVRGVAQVLYSDLTNAEATESTGLTSFNSNGYTAGSGSSNQNGTTYVGWQWKKGATPGFDIVTYTGNGSNQNINHSLGVAPRLMIVKNRTSGTPSWRVWHGTFNANEYIYLDATSAKMSGGVFPSVPTSTQFTIQGTDAGVGANGNNYVAYLFAEVAGFSKFGSYTGNGSTDGPFVYLGFRPRYVMLKVSSTTGDWVVYDTSRNTYNVVDLYLYPNSSAAEGGSGTPRLDILSNGFKLRQSGQDNTSGATYIYAAFAENPFKYSLAR